MEGISEETGGGGLSGRKEEEEGREYKEKGEEGRGRHSCVKKGGRGNQNQPVFSAREGLPTRLLLPKEDFSCIRQTW